MIVDRSTLCKALKSVRPAISKDEAVPILTHFLFNEDEITAFDLEIGVSVPFPIGLKGLVPATRFWNVVSNLSVEQLDLSVDGTTLKLSTKNHRSKFPLKPVTEFPAVVVRTSSEFQPLPADFHDALEAVRPTVNASRPELAGILIDGTNIVSSDGYRISWYRLEEPVPCGEKFMLSIRAITELGRLGTPTSILLEKIDIRFEYESGIQLLCQRPIPNFPDWWRTCLPKDEDLKKFESFDSAELGDALKRVGSFSGDKLSNVQSVMAFFDDRVEATYADAQSSIKETVKGAVLPFKGCRLHVDADSLADALERCSKAWLQEGFVDEANTLSTLYFSDDAGKFILALATPIAQGEGE